MNKLILVLIFLQPFQPVFASSEVSPPRGTLKKVVGISATVVGGMTAILLPAYSQSKTEKYFGLGLGAATIFVGVQMIRSGNSEGRYYREWQRHSFSKHGVGIQMLEGGPALAYELEF